MANAALPRAGAGRRFSLWNRRMPSSFRPFLMFASRAEEAMRFYVSLFSGSEVIDAITTARANRVRKGH